MRLVVAKVQDDIDAGRVVETIPSRNPMQTVTLLRAIRENKFDAAFGGARRDEEKARAKERVFSFRDEFGQWDPKAQRPELWNLYNGRHHKGEHIRVFPLSNWTEFDIWSYIGAEKIKLPSIYYAHQRQVFQRDGMLLAVHKYLQPRKDEEVVEKTVRFRTVGDVTCTGCVESTARDGVRGDRRDRGVAADRARRHPRRRPDLRSRHGRPQAGGLLLMAHAVLTALRDRGLGRRRQVHADRAAALRLQGRHGGPAGRRSSAPRKERGHDYTDLALVTDGLRAEREQGITIDVAYRYFATPKRKFIIADTPGTSSTPATWSPVRRPRSWRSCWSTPATGCWSSRGGTRSWRRCWASSTSCWRSTRWTSSTGTSERFEKIRDEFHAFAARLDVHDVTTIPMSALNGDNVVTKSDDTPWYEGPALLSHLEEVYIAGDRNLVDVRFPVQYVIRPQTHEHADHRSYAGTVASGVMRPGDEVVVLPSGKDQPHHRRSTVPSGPVDEAFPPMAVSISLADDIDISRGDLIARPQQPAARRRRTSTPWSAGWPTRRRWSRAATTSSSTPPGPPGPG